MGVFDVTEHESGCRFWRMKFSQSFEVIFLIKWTFNFSIFKCCGFANFWGKKTQLASFDGKFHVLWHDTHKYNISYHRQSGPFCWKMPHILLQYLYWRVLLKNFKNWSNKVSSWRQVSNLIDLIGWLIFKSTAAEQHTLVH